jgi:DNA-binding response OmpR family regulator
LSQVTARVVLAEDDADLRDLFERGLRRRGWEVTAVATGSDALLAAVASPPDVVVLDWSMPGLSGPETCEALKAESACAGVPVVLLTGRASPAEVAAALQAGADEHVAKPVGLDELHLLLTKVCRSH